MLLNSTPAWGMEGSPPDEDSSHCVDICVPGQQLSEEAPACTSGLRDQDCLSHSSLLGSDRPGLCVLWEQGPHRTGSLYDVYSVQYRNGGVLSVPCKLRKHRSRKVLLK